jgi:anti-anti-sigma factor
MIDTERVTASSDNGIETISGVGELDLYCAEQFRQALADAVASGNEIVVDFRKVSFIDTAIVAALVSPAKALMARGRMLKVVLVSGEYPQYVLKTVGFTDLMDIEAG